MTMRLLAALSLFLLPSLGLAAPTITTVAGTMLHGQSVTVTGSGFGAKSAAAPAYYDDFERATLTTAATIGTWSSINGMDAATLGRSLFSVRAAHKNLTADGYAAVAASSGTTSRKWYVNFWAYLDSDWDWGTSTYGNGDQMLSNIKYPVRFWRGSGNPNIYNSLGWSLASNGDNNVEFSTAGSAGGAVPLSKNAVTKGQWHQFAQEFVDVSAPLAADCEWRLWFDGHKVYERTGFDCNDATGAYRYPLFVGFYNAWGPPADSAPNDYYMDDVYVDTTLQRVEICDSATRSLATHCEIQLPTAWADTSITVTANQGSFPAGSNVYLYAVDANGVTSASSAPITIGTPSVRIAHTGYVSGSIK